MLYTMYNVKRDELLVYNRDTKKKVLFVQGYSRKNIPGKIGGRCSTEMLVWLAVHYKEEMRGAI